MLATLQQSQTLKLYFIQYLGGRFNENLGEKGDEDDDPRGIGNRWVDTKLVIQAYSIRELVGHSATELSSTQAGITYYLQSLQKCSSCTVDGHNSLRGVGRSRIKFSDK